MAKTATLSIRIEPKAKSQAEKIFAKLGITLSEAVNMFIHQSIIERALPFQPRAERPKIPNAATRAAMEEGDRLLEEIKAGTRKPRFETAEEALASLGI